LTTFRKKEEKKLCVLGINGSLRHKFLHTIFRISESVKEGLTSSLINVFSVGYYKNMVRTTIYNSLIKFWMR